MLPPPEMTAERLAEFMNTLALGEYHISIASAASAFVMPEGGTVITLPGDGRVVSIWPKINIVSNG